MAEIIGIDGKPLPPPEPQQKHYPPDVVDRINKLTKAFEAALKPYIGQTNVTLAMVETLKQEIAKHMPPADPPVEITFDPDKQTGDMIVATLIFKDPVLIERIKQDATDDE